MSRTLSSFIFIGVIVALVLWEFLYRIHAFPILILLIASFALREALTMAEKTGANPWRFGAWAMLAGFICDGWFGEMRHIHVIVLVGLMALFVHAMRHEIKGSLASVGAGMVCAIWIGVGFGSLIALWSWQGPEGISREGRYLVVFLMPVAMFQDVAAMWTGSLIGKHKLAPVLSPNKSVEGSIGGVAGSMFMALLIWFIYQQFDSDARGLPLMDFFTWYDAVALGFLCGTVGQIGDLSESLLKREADVKDSGWTGTGHGGVLDLFDSLLFCSTVMILYAFARGLWMYAG